MVKNITEYTKEELSAKIEAIKAERERTAEALKKYEEELERRKQEVPLGVPLESNQYGGILGTYYFSFTSDKTKRVFDGRLNDYVEALQKLAKGEPIDIKVLLPLLPKGWVACDSKGEWFVFSCKPFIRKKVGSKEEGIWDSNNHEGYIGYLPFNLKPADDWKTSLMECGL